MQKRAVRMRALAFDVAKEVAAKLARSSRADHRRIGDALTGFEWEMTEEFAVSATVFDRTLAQRMFEGQEPTLGDDG